MSTDGTQPPPRTPERSSGRSGVGTADEHAPRGEQQGAPGDPSVTDRLKRAAQGAADAARTAVPRTGPDRSGAPTDDRPTRDWSGPARPPGARPAAGRPAAGHPAPGHVAEERTTTAHGAGRPAAASSGPRRVRLAVARVDPWSVMKLAFLLSVAIGIMIVVAAAVVWYTLDSLHVFTQVNDVIATLAGSETFFNLLEFTSFERITSLATMIAVVDVILLTALSTIGAFLYNIVAALVGGIHLTLTDD